MVTTIKPLHILITDAHKPAGLGAVRSLGRAGHKVVAACPQDIRRSASMWSRYCSSVLYYPDAWRQHFAFREWLYDQAHHRTFDAVLPISEASIVGVAAVRKDLPNDFLPILPRDAALQFTLSKFQSTQVALALGMLCPTTAFVSEGRPEGGRNTDFSGLRFPIVVKTDNYLTPEGVYMKGRTLVAADPDEALQILDNLAYIQTRVIAQEQIPGHGTGAFFLRFDGTTHLRFAHRRLHEVPYTGGASSFRESCRDDELTALGERLLDAIDYEGLAMVEFRRGMSDNKPYFLEINGRLWGSLALALHCGIDFPQALLACYQGGGFTPSPRPYRSGMKCRNVFPGELNHLISILNTKTSKGVESPPSKFGAIAKFIALSCNPTIRHDYFWWSDPLPGIIQAVKVVAQYANTILRHGISKLRQRREDRLLKRFSAEHRARCKQPRYFHQPLHRVLFLCYGNICRSPFAEYYWNTRIRELSLAGPIASSAGFHQHTDRPPPVWIAEVAAEYAIDLTRHRSRLCSKSDVEMADAILVMDHKNYQSLVVQFPVVKHKTFFLGLFADRGLIEIDDPYGKSIDTTYFCYRQLVQALDGLLKRISA